MSNHRRRERAGGSVNCRVVPCRLPHDRCVFHSETRVAIWAGTDPGRCWAATFSEEVPCQVTAAQRMERTPPCTSEGRCPSHRHCRAPGRLPMPPTQPARVTQRKSTHGRVSEQSWRWNSPLVRNRSAHGWGASMGRRSRLPSPVPGEASPHEWDEHLRRVAWMEQRVAQYSAVRVNAPCPREVENHTSCRTRTGGQSTKGSTPAPYKRATSCASAVRMLPSGCLAHACDMQLFRRRPPGVKVDMSGTTGTGMPHTVAMSTSPRLVPYSPRGRPSRPKPSHHDSAQRDYIVLYVLAHMLVEPSRANSVPPCGHHRTGTDRAASTDPMVIMATDGDSRPANGRHHVAARPSSAQPRPPPGASPRRTHAAHARSTQQSRRPASASSAGAGGAGTEGVAHPVLAAHAPGRKVYRPVRSVLPGRDPQDVEELHVHIPAAFVSSSRRAELGDAFDEEVHHGCTELQREAQQVDDGLARYMDGIRRAAVPAGSSRVRKSGQRPRTAGSRRRAAARRW